MSLTADLTGKVALVTGASGDGFGRFFAGTLARAGAQVVVAARRLEPLEALAAELSAGGAVASARQLDVTDLDQVRDVVTSKPFDIIVNNAGLAISRRILEQTENDYDQVMDVNLKGVWNVGTEAARTMRDAGRPGSIINIASITGLRPADGIAPYAVSKAGVVLLTKQMAMELARYNIRVNAIAPGYFASDMTRDFLESDAGQALMKRIPMRRFGDYNSLGAVLLLLASDAASYMTGTVLTVDGGHTANSL